MFYKIFYWQLENHLHGEEPSIDENMQIWSVENK